MFVFVLILSITITRREYHKYFLLGVPILLILLFIIEYNFPELVTGYSSETDRFFDVTMTLILFMIVIALNIRALKINYEKEKEIVEEINQNMKAGNKYAAHIQHSIMKDPAEIIGEFNDGFIINQPKAEIGGDFYWYKNLGFKKILAVADCTGHGVSGALLSMLGISFLDEIILNSEKYSPDEILNELKAKMVQIMYQKDETKISREGMDMSIIAFDEKNNSLFYSGAVNSIYIISEGNFTELKADRNSICPFSAKTPYTLKHHTIKKGDRIFLFSDGYPDQLGGPDGKRVKYPRFQGLLKSGNNQKLPEVKRRLIEYHKEWSNPVSLQDDPYEQTDDIMIIGLEI
jgi:serine phosphatase RsbU (regulator of sigma subunit)